MCLVTHVLLLICGHRLAQGGKIIFRPWTDVLLLMDHHCVQRLRFDKQAILNPWSRPVAKSMWPNFFSLCLIVWAHLRVGSGVYKQHNNLICLEMLDLVQYIMFPCLKKCFRIYYAVNLVMKIITPKGFQIWLVGNYYVTLECKNTFKNT